MTNPPDPQTDRRDQIRRAIAEADGFRFESLEPHDYQKHADVILALFAAVPSAPVDRAAVLREAADALDGLDPVDGHTGSALLRRMADEGQQPVREPSVHGESVAHLAALDPRSIPADLPTLSPDEEIALLRLTLTAAEEGRAELRAENARLRAQLWKQPAVEEQPATAPVHVGGNAEDCPACSGTNPPYPFICPGPPAAVAQPGKEA